jgi:DNA-binding response OmpR family regulator
LTRAAATIVLIEDDEFIRETIAELLTSEGHRVLQAADGKQGLAVLRDCPGASLVLLDLWMPVMNGWQLLEALRLDTRFAALPVVVISAVGELPAPPRGAAALLKKPITLDALLASVAAHLRR